MKATVDNPYRDALVGAEIEDPVKAFFEWCIEREKIRCKREAGEAPPWTQDVVFQRGRFLNVFREDDNGNNVFVPSKAGATEDRAFDSEEVI